MMLMYPIAKPIAMVRTLRWPSSTDQSQVLDALLGTHQGVTYRKAELKTFVALAVNGEDRLSEEELKLIGSALEFAAKTVGDVMVRLHDERDKLMVRHRLRTCSPSLLRRSWCVVQDGPWLMRQDDVIVQEVCLDRC